MSHQHLRQTRHIVTAVLYSVMVPDHWAYLALAIVHVLAGVMEDD